MVDAKGKPIGEEYRTAVRHMKRIRHKCENAITTLTSTVAADYLLELIKDLQVARDEIAAVRALTGFQDAARDWHQDQTYAAETAWDDFDTAIQAAIDQIVTDMTTVSHGGNDWLVAVRFAGAGSEVVTWKNYNATATADIRTDLQGVVDAVVLTG